MYVCVYPSDGIHVVACGPIVTKFGTHSSVLPRGVGGGGFRGSEIQKSGITTKRVDQLAPNLVHACGFIWEWT